MAQVPQYLIGNDQWALQFFRENGRWPTFEELQGATSNWWETPGAQTKTNYTGGYGVREAADTFARNHGRMPGLAEMPQALKEWAYSKTGEPPAEERAYKPNVAAQAVSSQIAPILQGTGKQTLEDIMQSKYLDYATVEANVGPNQGTIPTFADYLRGILPGMLYNRGVTGGPAEESQPTSNMARGLTWQDIMAEGKQDRFDVGGENENAVYGAWMNQFAPNAWGGQRASIVNKLRDTGALRPGVASSVTGNTSFAEWLNNQMAGYL